MTYKRIKEVLEHVEKESPKLMEQEAALLDGGTVVSMTQHIQTCQQGSELFFVTNQMDPMERLKELMEETGILNLVNVIPSNACTIIMGVPPAMAREETIKKLERQMRRKLHRDVVIVPDNWKPIAAVEGERIEVDSLYTRIGRSYLETDSKQ